jgi:hypothetical protein
MAAAKKIGLFGREIREWISPPALEILLGAAERITEGSFEGPPGPRQAYLGSIQLQIPLSACAEYLAEPLDASAARRVAELLRTDAKSREILLEVARQEAQRAAGCQLHELHVEIDSSHRGDTIIVGMDVEARVQPLSAGYGGRGAR